jgi:hypothetical protein
MDAVHKSYLKAGIFNQKIIEYVSTVKSVNIA